MQRTVCPSVATFTVTPGVGQNAIAWTAPINTLGAYTQTLTRSPAFTGSVTPTGLTYTDTAVTGGTTYTYSLTITDSRGSVYASAAKTGSGTVPSTGGGSAPIFTLVSPSGYTPLFSFMAGHGADCAGGLGHDAISGGLSAPTTIYKITNESQFNAFRQNTNSRSIGLVTTSKLFSTSPFGVNAEQRFSTGNKMLVDVSGGTGAFFRGVNFTLIPSVPDIAYVNVQGAVEATDPAFITGNGGFFGMLDTNTVRRLAIVHCGPLWGVDQLLSLYYSAIGVCVWSTWFCEPLSNAGHPDGLHSSSIITGWKYATTQMSVLRSGFISSMSRNPLSDGRDLHMEDCLIVNAGDTYAELQQQPGGSFPSRANFVNNIGVAGPNDAGASLFRLGLYNASFDTSLHAGSQVALLGNEMLNRGTYASQNAAPISQIASQPTTNVTRLSSKIAAAQAPGYNSTTIGTGFPAGTAAVRARAIAILSQLGPRPALRAQPYTRLAAEATAMINATTGQGTGAKNAGQQTWPSTFSNTDFDLSAFAGCTNSTTPFALGAAGRTIQTNGRSAFANALETHLATLGVKAY